VRLRRRALLGSLYGIAMDSAGALYVCGFTQSDEGTLPVSVGPDLSYNGNSDGLVVKLSSSSGAVSSSSSSAAPLPRPGSERSSRALEGSPHRASATAGLTVSRTTQ